jgi:hypothetical protein
MKKIQVSDLFVEIYKKFNIVDQSSHMPYLSKKELFLLVLTTISTFDEDDKFLQRNYKPLEDELIEINNFLDLSDEDKKNHKNYEILSEISEIYPDDIVDLNGDPLPEILTSEQAIIERRQLGISEILNK